MGESVICFGGNDCYRIQLSPNGAFIFKTPIENAFRKDAAGPKKLVTEEGKSGPLVIKQLDEKKIVNEKAIQMIEWFPNYLKLSPNRLSDNYILQRVFENAQMQGFRNPEE